MCIDVVVVVVVVINRRRCYYLDVVHFFTNALCRQSRGECIACIHTHTHSHPFVHAALGPHQKLILFRKMMSEKSGSISIKIELCTLYGYNRTKQKMNMNVEEILGVCVCVCTKRRTNSGFRVVSHRRRILSMHRKTHDKNTVRIKDKYASSNNTKMR